MSGYGHSVRLRYGGVTRHVFDRLYISGDGITDIKDANGLMAPRVAVCANHQANMVLRLILGETEP